MLKIFFYSLLWGYMADVKGKRPTLVASTVAVMLSTLAFGFTYNFKWAVTMRFMQGASSGQICFYGSLTCNKSVLLSYLHVFVNGQKCTK